MSLEFVQINALPLKPFTATVNIPVQEAAGGTGSTGYATSQSAVDFMTSTETNLIHVSEGGDDTNGNGSVLRPYATLSHALSTITDTIYRTVILSGKIVDAGTIELLPTANIRGETQGTYLNNSNPIVINTAAFEAFTGGSLYIQDLELNDFNFDLSAISSSYSMTLYTENLYPGAFTVIGGTHAILDYSSYGSFYFSPFNLDVVLRFLSFDDFFQDILTVNNSVVYIFNGVVVNAVIGTSYTNTALNVNIIRSDISSIAITAPGSLSFDPGFKISQCNIGTGTHTIDGAKAILLTDVSSTADYTITNGAQIQLLSDAKFLREDHTPVNYTPVNQTVDGHFQGVDTALLATSTNTVSTLVKRDSSGDFAAGNVNLTGATIAAGVSGFNITGTNAACNVGTNLTLAQSTGTGSFFTGTVNGDCCIRQLSTSLSLLMGVGSATPQFDIQNAQILANVGIKLPTSGATQGLLDYYEENVAFNLSMSTPDGTNHDLPLTVTRSGKIVVINYSTFLVTSSVATFFASVTPLPSKWRPVGVVKNIVQTVDNSLLVYGLLTITSAGDVSFKVGQGNNYTPLGSATIEPGSVAYVTS